MSAEKENDKREKSGLCGCCDGTFEIIKGCFPDDAGYAACLARMNGNRESSVAQKPMMKQKERIRPAADDH